VKPKVACLVPVRNKAHFVEQTVISVLTQTYEPMEIILSDQGSTDNSLSILQKLKDSYSGPNKVRVVECPFTDVKGLGGLNVHLNWLNEQTDADLLIIVSADDLCHPDRVKRTVEIYEQHRPSLIGTAMQFINPDGTVEGVTQFTYEREGVLRPSGLVTARQHIECLVGGSCSMAWDREFYDKVGGLHGHQIVDVYLPFLATLDRGFYFLNEQLFAYVRHPDPSNAGLGGQMLAAKDDYEKLQLNELSNYQVVSTLYATGRKAVEQYMDKWNGDAAEALFQNIVHRTNDWAMCRDLMTENKVTPRSLS
jgi:glycosyltransferase involved in cell wall biosynthesis